MTCIYVSFDMNQKIRKKKNKLLFKGAFLYIKKVRVLKTDCTCKTAGIPLTNQ